MKAQRTAFVLSVWFALCISFVTNPSLFAQTPKGTPKTIVIHGNGEAEGGWWSNLEWDGDKTVLLYTTEPDWDVSNVCYGEPIVTDTIHDLTRILASGKFSSFFRAPLKARLYYPATFDDIWPFDKLCSFLRNVEPAAEGIIQGRTSVQNAGQICEFLGGPGRQQLIITLAGSLYNISMPCPGRHVSVNLEHHFQLKKGAIVDPDTCSTDFSNIEIIKYVMDVHCLP